MKKSFYFTAILFSIISCERELDHPPVDTLNASQIITIDSLRGWQESSVSGQVYIQQELSVYGIVTMDESSGNIYKNLYIQDHTAGINIRLTSSSDFQVGDSIRISLNGALLSEYSGVIQLDLIDPTKMIVKQSSNNEFLPTVKTVDQITLADEAMLIKLENVQFMTSELSFTFADAPNQSSENRIIEDCSSGNTMIVRTSGFANYAGTNLPTGKGSMVCIVNQFNGELQLILRSFDEVKLTGTRCAGQLVNKNFDDGSVTSGGWSVMQVVGTETWITNGIGSPDGTDYGVIDNFNSGNTTTESWLISPSLDFSASTTPTMSFINAYKYAGAPLQLLISTTYSGTGNPNLSTWASLSATWSTGNFIWADSGIISLSGYLQSNVHIAFKYTGSNSDGSTWEIDNIIVNG